MQDNKQSASPMSSTGALIPEMVKDIPIAAPSPALKPPKDDEDLDKIMRDVGQDLKQVGSKKPKHHLFSRRSGPKQPKPQKAEAKFTARPIDQIKPPPAKPAAAVQARPQAPLAAQPAAKAPAPAKPVRTARAPVGIILLALAVTGGLVAAAFYAYK
jgi:hypothetical protein